MSDFWLTTPRLGLRRFTQDDLDWLTELRHDADVMRYAGGPQDRADSADLLRVRILEYYDAHPGLGIWMTVERATHAPIGFHLLNHIRGESIIQVGFFLKTAVWGCGFATEMALALLAHGFETLMLPYIAGMASLENHASQRVLTKIGLLRRGERAFPHPAYAATGAMAWFERDAAGWLHEHRR